MKFVSSVWWITGLSGAGKTTVGKILCNEFCRMNRGVVHLDGDVLRNILGAQDKFEKKDRFELAMKYSKLAKEFADQGNEVVVSTISMFHSVRDWNRKCISNYREIYLRVPLSERQKRDPKGLYERSSISNKSPMVDLKNEYEEPKTPDLIIDNFGNMTASQCVSEIFKHFEIK